MERGRGVSLLRRWTMGVLALLIAVMGPLASVTAPMAQAQTGVSGVGEAAEAGAKVAGQLTKDMAEVAVKLCVGNDTADGGAQNNTVLVECLKKGLGDVIDAEKVIACMVGATGDDAPATGPEAESGKSLRECLEEFIDKPEEEEKDAPDLSLGRMSSALTSFYVNALVPGGAGQNDGGRQIGGEELADMIENGLTEKKHPLAAWSKVMSNMGNAGSFLGRPDSKARDNTQWLMGPGDSRNNSVYSYSAFDRHGYTTAGADIKGAEAHDEGMFSFATYGALISGMGFDESISADDAFDPQRKIMGSAMLVAYIAAGLVDTIFASAVSVLAYLNPFNLLIDAIRDNTRAEFTAGIGGEEIPGSALDGLKDFINTVYSGTVQLGWQVVIPLSIAVTVLGAAMYSRFNKGKHFKHLIVRMFFVIIMVPLLGVTYTAGLDSMKGAAGDAATGSSSKIVLSTYVDFDKWVNEYRLDMPGHAGRLKYDVRAGQPTDESLALARDFTLRINGMVNPAWENLAPKTNASQDVGWGTSMTEVDESNRLANSKNSAEQFTEVVGLLNRYINGETISAGAYESDVKAALSAAAAKHEDKARDIRGWVESYTNAEKIASMDEKAVNEMVNPVMMVQREYIKGESGNPGDGIIEFTKTNDANRGSCPASRVTTTGWSGDVKMADNVHAACVLSPLSMYNYLNTAFDATSARTYSPDQTSNEFARVSHASVAAVGSGAMPIIYWFSSISLLMSFSLIGILYAMSMVINTIKRGFQLIAAIPFGAMGFMAGIAKTIIYTIAMFLEIFLTFFVFKLVQEFLLVIPQLIERPLIGNLGGEGGDVAAGIAGAGLLALAESNPLTVVTVVTLISTLGVIMFTVMALKLRSTLISAMDEAVTRAINKFLDTNVSSATSGGAPSALRQGIARGAGLAAAHQMMSGGYGGNMENDPPSDQQDNQQGDPNNDPARSNGPDNGPDGPSDPDGPGSSPDGPSGPGGSPDSPNSPDGPDMQRVSNNPDNQRFDFNRAQIPLAGGGVASMLMDNNGTLLDNNGNAMLDSKGAEISANDVTGINSAGQLMDRNGNPMTDLYGEPVMANADGTALAPSEASTLMNTPQNPVDPNANPEVPMLNDPSSPYQQVSYNGGSPEGIPGTGSGGSAEQPYASSSMGGPGGGFADPAGGSTGDGYVSGGDPMGVPSGGNGPGIGDNTPVPSGGPSGGPVDTPVIPVSHTTPAGGGDGGGIDWSNVQSAGVGAAAALAAQGARSLGGDASTGQAASNAVQNLVQAAPQMRDATAQSMQQVQQSFGGGNSGGGNTPPAGGYAPQGSPGGYPQAPGGGYTPASNQPSGGHGGGEGNSSVRGASPVMNSPHVVNPTSASQPMAPSARASMPQVIGAQIVSAGVTNALGGNSRGGSHIHESTGGSRFQSSTGNQSATGAPRRGGDNMMRQAAHGAQQGVYGKMMHPGQRGQMPGQGQFPGQGQSQQGQHGRGQFPGQGQGGQGQGQFPGQQGQTGQQVNNGTNHGQPGRGQGQGRPFDMNEEVRRDQQMRQEVRKYMDV